MLTKTERDRFQKQIQEIVKEHSSERVAIKLGVRNGTVLNWASARRTPKKPTVQLIEQFWSCRILDK